MTDIIRQSRGQCHCLRVQRGTQRPCASGRPQPGPAAGAGSNGKPFSTQGRAAARVGPPVTRRPPGPLPTGLGLPHVTRRARLPEAEAAGSLTHARPGRRLCRVGASPAARRGRCPRGWDCRLSPAGPPPTGLGLPPFVNRARLPEAEAAGSLTHARPGRRLCRVGASPAARRGRCPRGWDCRLSPAGPPPTGLGLPPFVNRGRLPEPEAAGSPSRARPGRRPCRVSASPVARRATAHGVGTAARRPPGQTAGGGSGGKPHPRKVGPPPRVGLGLSLLRPPGPAAGAGSNGKLFAPQSRGRRPRGCVCLPQPAGSGRRSRKQRKAFPARGRGRRPRGCVCLPQPAGPDCRRRKRREASPTQGRAAAPCRAARHPPSAGAVAHGVGTAARRPPGPSPAWDWDCRPSPAGPDCRRRKRREAPPTQGRAAARVGLARRPAPHGAPRTTADMQNPGNAVTFYPVDTSYMQV